MTKLHRWAIVLLKYSPLIAGVMMLLHVALLLCGVHLHIAENIVGLPILPTIVCCVWSKAFGFCAMHRAFTIYTCIMTYCINYQSDTILGFGEGLLIARCMMLGFGICMCIWFMIEDKRHGYRCTRKDFINEE